MQVISTPVTSIITWMVVPALAGSTPALASAKGRLVPASTEVMTMLKRDREMASESVMFLVVRNTLTNPPPPRKAPKSNATCAC
eukprot:scaffold2636_cov340-Pavlova_lutheri.AAC.174